MWRSILTNYRNQQQEQPAGFYPQTKRSPPKLSETPWINVLASDGTYELVKIIFDHKCVILKKTLLHELYDLESFKNQLAMHNRATKLDNVAKILEFQVHREPDLKEYAYLVYEFRGDSLSNNLVVKTKERIPYSPEECRKFVASLAKTLEGFQRMQVVHLGLSPISMIVGPDGTACIGSLESAVPLSEFITGTGICEYLPLPFGSVAFLAPEVISFINSKEGKEAKFNPYAASVYSVGLLVVQMLSLIPDIHILGAQAKDIPNLIAKQAESEPEGPAKLFLNFVRKVILDPVNENRIDYISLNVLFEYVNNGKAEALFDAVPLERTKSQSNLLYHLTFRTNGILRKKDHEDDESSRMG